MSKATYQENTARLEDAKKRAFDNRDSVAYFRLCNKLGYIDDQELYEQGSAEIMMREGRNAKIGVMREGKVAGTSLQTVCDDAEKEKWVKIARVALSRFPELEIGESISDREIRRRLSQIKQSGYDVEPYSKMSKAQAWAYLIRIRADITRQASEIYPEVVREVRANNARLKEDARYIR